MGIGVDSSGGVFVSDTMNHTIRKMAPSGAVATVAGLPGTFGNADGTGPDARFYQPIGLALDRFGTITIADAANHFIRRSVATAGATAFHPAPPCRLFDTRDTIGPATAAPALAPGETRLFAIEGRCSIPASAGSLSVNQTVTAPAASGELVLSGRLPLPADRQQHHLPGREDPGQQRHPGTLPRRERHLQGLQQLERNGPLHPGRERLLPVAVTPPCHHMGSGLDFLL
ncbi:MAG: hypothetical protein IPN83_13675 [Holophagales bacterium]|nr:hypothetical protein [Holophagales bacterium]